MVKFLELEPKRTRSTRLMEGLSAATQSIPDLIGSYQKSKQMGQAVDYLGLKGEQREGFLSLPEEIQSKVLPGLISEANKRKGMSEKIKIGASRYLKEFRPKLYGIESIRDKIATSARKYFDEGMGETEAYDRAISDYEGSKGSEKGPPQEEGLGWEHLFGLAGPALKQVAAREKGEESDLIKGLGRTGVKGLMEGISEVGSELPGAAYKSATSPIAGLTLAGAGFPTAGSALAAAPALTELARHKGVGLTPRELIAKQKPAGKETYFDNPFTKAQEWINEKARKGKTPEERAHAEETQNVLSTLLDLVMPTAASKLLSKGSKAISPSEILPPERAMIEAKPKISEPPSPKPPVKATPTKTVESPLKGRITEPPETPTERRMERVSPEKRVYPRLENVELREKQLKNHSKYVQEIETDAAERAERAEKRAPKTVKGRQSQQIRIHEAEKNYPVAQESYNKAAGRVRALEDEVVKLKGEARESAETLLELAKKDLDDATFNLKQAYENLTGVNVRAGVEKMRDAARSKMQDIQEAIGKGEEYKIAKMDYSSDLITKANAISKSKPLPKAPQSDFYTQVHDVYANEYRNRVAGIDKQLKGRPSSMADLYNRRQLQAEKDILNKMIKSAEAEKAIQNRRFGLREMAERHKAQERFKQLKKDGAKPEVSKVAQERMWKTRMEEAKTPQERGAVIDEAVEQIANEHPEQAARVRVEGENLKSSIENLFKPNKPKAPPSVKGERVEFGGKGPRKSPPPPRPPAAEPLPSPKGKGIPSEEEIFGNPKTTAEAAKNSLHYIRKLQKTVDEMLSKIPIIGKHWFVRDAIFGAFSALADELHKEYKFPFTGADIVNVIAGRPGYGGLRYIVRRMGKEAGKWAVDWFKTERAASALKKEEPEKFSSYSPRIQKKAKKRVYET